ncbi:MAG: hypothetical protein HY795_12705 [Desulfovibrio sp.]|nr:hypothetical protein [Desulfovibrio sp.]MBI4960126.1 hypothetical protein [Desulfovibrio sp.]
MNHSISHTSISRTLPRGWNSPTGMGGFAARTGLVLLLACLSAVLTGCGTAGGAKYTMHLDAYAEHVPYEKRFVVLQGIMEVKPKETEQFNSAAEVLAKALEAKGYVRAAGLDQADLGIYLAYRVVEDSRAPFDNFRPRTPGIAPQQLFLSEYTREVLVEAVDMARYKAGGSKSTVWTIRVASKGPTSDMGKAMPYIAAAVAQYMGTSSELYLEVDSDFNIKPFKPAKPHRRP